MRIDRAYVFGYEGPFRKTRLAVHCRNANRVRGLTLFEILVAMSILGVVTAFAIPSFVSISANSSLATEVNELVATLQLARSEAVTRGQNVTICTADAGFAACAGTGNWGGGWLVLDSAANVIRVHGALPDNVMAEINVVGAVGAIVFNRNGFTADARTIKLCDPQLVATRARGVIISADGRVRLASDSDGNRIVEDLAGADVTCP